MDELTSLKIKAIAFTVKQEADEHFDELMAYVNIFKVMKKKDQKKWVDKCEEHYKNQLPQGTNLPNLYEIGKAYLRWQVYLDLYEKGFETKEPVTE